MAQRKKAFKGKAEMMNILDAYSTQPDKPLTASGVWKHSSSVDRNPSAPKAVINKSRGNKTRHYKMFSHLKKNPIAPLIAEDNKLTSTGEMVTKVTAEAPELLDEVLEVMCPFIDSFTDFVAKHSEANPDDIALAVMTHFTNAAVNIFSELDSKKKK